MKKTPVIAVVGPTASGKTALSIEIAKLYNAEIVSCDSMQIYKGMDIATAKPDKLEMQGIAHHLMSEVDRTCDFSVSMYKELAQNRISEIISRKKNVVIVGGTGLYVQSLLYNIEYIEAPKNEEIRKQLENKAQELGTHTLLDELMAIDEQTANKLHTNDKSRIIRALEIYYTSGKTMSEQVESSRKNPSPYNFCIIGLDFKDRQKLYDRINKRVDIMIENGLIEETKQYMTEEHKATAHQAIGCKEMSEFLNGSATLKEATEKLKMETRRYAKRQLTWFRKEPKVNWLYVDETDCFSNLLKKACEIINKSEILEG
ncbi:MAG: tRNA (adenosine(37)-N6)-dimethylallyltransferase MiaA [Oscillospiraceae bacterium]